jgi:hypothetical protein
MATKKRVSETSSQRNQATGALINAPAISGSLPLSSNDTLRLQKGANTKQLTSTNTAFQQFLNESPLFNSRLGTQDVPQDSTRKDIVFNKDGSVSITRGGVTEVLSAGDYKDLLAVQRGEGESFNPIIQELAKSDLQVQQEAAGQNLAGQVGQLTPQQLALIGQAVPEGASQIQAIGAGLGNVIPYAAGGIAGGAAIGAAAGAGIGAVPGAVIGGIGGAVGGFTRAYMSNLKSQRSGFIRADTIELSTAKRNLRAIITDTNQNPQNAAENLALFNEQLARVQAAYSKLKLQTKEDLSQYLGDGTAELAQFEAFNTGGEKDLYIQRMQIALLNPDPNKVMLSTDDIGLDNE